MTTTPKLPPEAERCTATVRPRKGGARRCTKRIEGTDGLCYIHGRQGIDKPKVGRIGRFNESTIARLEQAFVGCMTDLEAIEWARIEDSTFYKWMREGRLDAAEGRATPKAQFFERITLAREGSLVAMAGVVAGKALTDADFALRLLAIRRPKEWARREHIELAGGALGQLHVFLPKLEERSEDGHGAATAGGADATVATPSTGKALHEQSRGRGGVKLESGDPARNTRKGKGA